MPVEREEVAPEDLLDRHVFHPPMFPGGEILFSAFFEFPRKENECESVIWRRHVNGGLDSIHRMGCERQTEVAPNRETAGAVR